MKQEPDLKRDTDSLLEHGKSLEQAGNISDAKAIYQSLLEAHPEDTELLELLGTAEARLGNLHESIRLFSKIIEIAPERYPVYLKLGDMYHRDRRLEEALACFMKALTIYPNYTEAHFHCGFVLNELHRREEAMARYQKVLALKPDHILSYNNLGIILADLNRADEALACYDKALALNPDYLAAHFNRGIVLYALKRREEALASYDKAIAIDPTFFGAYNNRGMVLNDLGRREEALASYDVALTINPDSAEVYNNKGIVFFQLKRPEEALACYDKALTIFPDYADVYYNRGNSLNELGRREEAIACFEKAVMIKPNIPCALGFSLLTRQYLSDWDQFDTRLPQLIQKIQGGECATFPYPAVILLESPELQRRVSEIYVSANYATTRSLPARIRSNGNDKIRLGYFSSDFGDHPVTHLVVGMLENHDRNRFEVYAFSFGSDRRDDWRTRVEKAVDRFVDVHNQSDSDIAALARDMGIDIAIDLNGFTKNFRMGIFAERAAPLQVSYIGYLGTSGAPFIDYLVAEATIIPEDKQKHYSEQIVYLPCYQGSDYSRTASSRIFSKTELGLPETGFVFCSFNSNYKITPEVYARWMQILTQVPGSVLWLYVSVPSAIENLRRQAEHLGVNTQRIIFAQSIPRDDHLARMSMADLFLDTFPCNAGATAADALWMGLPILTLMGESFASRVAASLVAAVGLGELITHTPQEYTELAIRLAMNPDLLSNIRQRLADHLPGCQLFDSKQFTRNIESAYVAMYERHERGLAPMHLHIPPTPSAN